MKAVSKLITGAATAALIAVGAAAVDAVIAACVDRPLAQVDPPVLDVLRLGAHQLLRTRIPPHTGSSNVRATIHLPLVVPPGCGFRVGAETRAWEEGRAWAFDDTIEHEAWNESGQPRAILIVDAWNPLLTEVEREAVRLIG